jgi:hypothetical protein
MLPMDKMGEEINRNIFSTTQHIYNVGNFNDQLVSNPAYNNQLTSNPAYNYNGDTDPPYYSVIQN